MARLRGQELLLVFVLLPPWAFPARAAQIDSPRKTISLDGRDWKLAGLPMGQGEELGVYRRGVDKAHFIATSVPNDVQLAIGLKDPYGQGPEIVEINQREWWYVRSFPSPQITAGQQVRMVFDGVDYFADVWLNGKKLGSHEGAYTRFSFNITRELIVEEENYLAVRVTAPWKVPGRSHYEYMKGEFVEQWDALPGPGQVVFPLGLHRSVRIEITQATRVEEFQLATIGLGDARAELKVRAAISNFGAPYEGALRVAITPENFSGPALNLLPQPVSFAGQPGEKQEIEFSAQVPHPQLWWTWDQGPQNLYTAQVTLVDAQGTVRDRASTLFGIRTLERDANLLYKLNGRPVFLRGAWYPMSHLFPASADRWTYEKDLRLARHANMNHLVNYTVVEKDDFYELADRLGILLFVELPFNQLGPLDTLNGRYPRRDDYLRWCSEEVAQIVRALANHPSVGVWSAVSETTTNGQDFTTSWDFRVVEAADGYRLFVKRIEDVVRANDPDALYFRSYCDFGEHHFWEGSLFQGTTYDQHFDATAQFVSEYGGLAYFPYESIRRIIDPGDVWSASEKRWSNLNLPVNLKKLSYLTGFGYAGLGFLTSDIEENVDRQPRSFLEYVGDSQVYQAFLYGYAADAYRRKLFVPINGIRSWMFKDFPEKPIAGFGVIDCFDAPHMAYYAQRRTFAPVSMSFAARYALESLPAGAPWKVPVWISNATTETLSLLVQTSLFNLKGNRLRELGREVSVQGMRAEKALDLDWQLPDEAGIYLLRGQARNKQEVVASTELYVKVAPRVTRQSLRVLLVGSREWVVPIADYLKNFGALVTTAVHEPTVVRKYSDQFPDSPESLRERFDVIWLGGFNNYWREAPERWTEIIFRAVELGVTFVHSGSWASFHGGEDDRVAALDLTPLAKLLPVEVEHENDVFATRIQKSTGNVTAPVAFSRLGSIKALPIAPDWLKQTDFTGLWAENYHMLNPKPGASVLLDMDVQPLMVTGHYGKGRTIAYLGFSPEGNSGAQPDNPIILDRVIRSSMASRLFAIVSASILALAANREPLVSIGELMEARATPLFQTLKNTPWAGWPEISLTWANKGERGRKAVIHIHNGPGYLRGFRLRFEGPDFLDGKALSLWSNQFFDLLPYEDAECAVEILTAENKALKSLQLEAEALNTSQTKTYQVSVPAP